MLRLVQRSKLVSRQFLIQFEQSIEKRCRRIDVQMRMLFVKVAVVHQSILPANDCNQFLKLYFNLIGAN
jgi:hypothetical protein